MKLLGAMKKKGITVATCMLVALVALIPYAMRAQVGVWEKQLRAPSGNGTLHFILGDDIKYDPNFRGQYFVVNSCNPSGSDDGKEYIYDGQEFKNGVGHFHVGLTPLLVPGKTCECFSLDAGSKDIFSHRGSQYEITVLVNGKVHSVVPKNKVQGAVWERTPAALYKSDVDIYIRKVDKKIQLTLEHYVEGRKIEAPDGLKVVYDKVRQAGWDASSGGEVKIPRESTLQYSWELGGVQVDGVTMQPERIEINGSAVSIPKASESGEWVVPKTAGAVTIKVHWKKADVRKITYSANITNPKNLITVEANGQQVSSGGFIDKNITKVKLEAKGVGGKMVFAVSVNGIVEKWPDKGAGKAHSDEVTLPAGGKDVDIVVYYVQYNIKHYIVTIDPNITDGIVTVNPQVAKKDDRVDVTITPKPGYAVVEWIVHGTGAVDGYAPSFTSFKMPDYDVELKVVFKRTLEPLSFKVLLEGAGVKDAEVTVTDDENKVYPSTGTLKTNASGVATVAEVPVLLEKGKVTVVATLGGVKHTVKIPITTNGNGEATPNSFNFRKVIVKVRDRKTHGDLEGVTVSFGAQDVVLDGGVQVKIGAQKVKTDETGVATLYHVGDVKDVKFEKTGYRSATLAHARAGVQNLNFVELLPALPDVTFTVSPGATVTINNGNGKSYEATAEAGKTEVKVPSVPDIATGGTVTVKAAVDGQERVVTVPVTVTNGTASPNDLTLHEVRVTVVELGATPEKAIAGATVTAGAQVSATTGADGVARLYLVKGVNYEGAKAEAAGYTARTVKLEVKADGSVAPSEVALAKAGSHSVSFTVDKGATVTVSDPTNGSHTATAGPNDTQVSVPGVSDVATGGTVTVTAGGKTVTVPVKVENGAATPSDLTLHEVRVTVVEAGATPEKVIAGATVTVGGQPATAGANGEATLHLVKNVTYRDLGAAAADYIAISGKTLTVDAAGVASPTKIELAKAGTHSVDFTVNNGAKVTVTDGNNETHTAQDSDNNGSVTVPGVPDVTHGKVKVELPDGTSVEMPVTVAGGAASPSVLTLRPVTVTVVEAGATPEKVIAGATVTVGGQPATADGSGVATLRLVRDVTYRDLKAEATGYAGISGQTLAVDGSGNATPSKIELAKKAAGQSDPYLHVFVVDENLQAIDKVSVSVKGVGSDSTDLAGHVAWKLTAGPEYELTLKKEGYVTVTTSVRLEALGHDLTVVMQRVAQEDPKKEDPKGQVTAVESALLAGASLYPNPAREYTTLRGLEHADAVSILTLSGVEVQRLAVPGEREHKLDVSSLAEGIYLVVLETRGGERRVLKLVVRR